MSESKPTVDPTVVASAVEGAPDRVRRRLDRTPDAAAQWTWQSESTGWSITAGQETVHLPADHVTSLDQVECSCLLSPNCFHVMACLTALEVADAAANAGECEASMNDSEAVSEVASGMPNDRQRRAAATLMDCIQGLIDVGVSSAGVTVQSGLMRAVHQCRADGLHRAAALGLRILEGTRQVRRQADDADPWQLAVDMSDCIETAHHIANGESIEEFWFGTARRKQHPVRPKRLHGLLAEPVLTRTGYAGVTVYFLGEDNQIYSIADVRPGGSELCRTAYRGGIDVGPMVEAAHKLARYQYVTSEMTASQDGRLGRGKSVKIASQECSHWDSPVIAKRFAESLPDQWDRVYQNVKIPPDVRALGWDFVFVQATVIGIAGPELLVNHPQEQMVLRLTIANDSESLHYRENLRMLGHAPGLAIRLIGRVDIHSPTTLEALALTADDPELSPEATPQPQLDLPSQLRERVNLGLDQIDRHCLINGRDQPLVVGDAVSSPEGDALDPLRRRWVAMMLGGDSSARRTITNTIAGEIAALDRSGFSTGAALLDAISRQGKNRVETFLATGVYLRRCTAELAKSQASLQ